MPTLPRKCDSRSACSRTRARSIWGLVLLYVVSQGPIPVFHYHGDADALHSGAMANHLRTCHNPDCKHHVDPQGWHCHILLPGMTTEVPLGEDDLGQVDQGVPLLAAKVNLDMTQTNGFNPVVALPEGILAGGQRCSALLEAPALSVRHFLDGFADDLSLPERLSIARC